MNEKTETKLYNMGLDLIGWAIVMSVVLTIIYLMLPINFGFYGSCIGGAVIGFIISWPVFTVIEKYKTTE